MLSSSGQKGELIRCKAILKTLLSPVLQKQEVPFEVLNNTFPSKDFRSLQLKVTIVIISKKRFIYLGSFGKSILI